MRDESQINDHMPAVLSIAGSDPSGGAGIQADIKTFVAAGVYGAAAITVLTVQNTAGVSDVIPLEPDFIKQQIHAVLSDIPIDVIKTGMLFDDRIALAVAPFLETHVVVCDPVMVASSGDLLEGGHLLNALEKLIFPACDYITPNVDELERICGLKDVSVLDAVEIIFKRFPGLSGIVVKGGHIDKDLPVVCDRLFFREHGRVRIEEFRHKRVKSGNFHGTGCTFASAFAAFLAKKKDAFEAFRMASQLTAGIISLSAGYDIGSGNSPLMHHLWRTQ